MTFHYLKTSGCWGYLLRQEGDWETRTVGGEASKA